MLSSTVKVNRVMLSFVLIRRCAALSLILLVGLASTTHAEEQDSELETVWPGGGGQREAFAFPAYDGFPVINAETTAVTNRNAAPSASLNLMQVDSRRSIKPSPSSASSYVASSRVQRLSNPRTDNQRVETRRRQDVALEPAGFRRLPASHGTRYDDRSIQPTAAELLPFHQDASINSPRVSDTFVETDVRQAIQSLAGQIDSVVIIDDQVRGTATAIIDDQSFDTALKQVLLPLGFVHRQVDGIYYVGLADAESALFDWLSDRYRYTALHRDPAEIASLLPERHRQFVRISPTGGWLVVEAPPAHASQVLNEIEQLDQPVPQVTLEAMICVYSPEASFRFGFDVNAGVQLYDRSTQLALSGLSLASTIGPGAAVSNLNDFQVTSSLLRMLEQKGFVKIRATPRVMALDGQKAQIHIGRESFFSVQPEATGFVLRQDVQKVDSGIMLEITPAIRDPYVTVKIDRAEVSEDIRSDETQANASDRFPVINRRSVSTTVKVLDGETIVIGGLTQRQKVDLRNKVPFFGDLPVVGRLFNRVEKIDSKAEVAIFISPRILKEEALGGLSCNEPSLAHADGVSSRRSR